ncbi:MULTISPECIES: helix-turn-helix transcriptional regulator [Alteromonadaceae]|uniref:helix-turn-helix transcriptional regulator n=1 Tax=Alteromonadaceae TaxID=72275 RepID=UPI001C09131D|nr:MULTISPECIES: helix-turn-helix domain-containing protein [Aliiglaciecola]MBU2878767.1 helix-turn-helix domain-containing protein [Aliiglaciecola lipolytica]MDO6711335.1 helix-turn-helix domain-containing protein [Aliiglaciecola sp. 2_MG-2023]MDO6752216.1 helix-turn-helix domain-containing protein [Aliiglaciecola sp. 1_MG-2023]
MGDMSLYQIAISSMLVGWFIGLILVWVRYEQFPHAKLILTAILVWPLLLLDEWLKLSGYQSQLNFLVGSSPFFSALIIACLVLSIRQLTLAKFANNNVLFFIPTVLLLAGQLPLWLAPTELRIGMLQSPPMGDILLNWPFYATYLFSAFVTLSFAVHAAEYLASYHYYLSDQVVDIDIFEMRFTSNGCYVLMFTAFLSICVIGLAAFDLLPIIVQWQTLVNMLNATGCLYLILLLVQNRKYSPTPFAYSQMDKGNYSEDQLRHTLKQAEKAIIQHKAYKRKGLRIKQVADAAQVEPAALALATRFVLKRNFRAFVYHYRLEYAKKVLMRTDQKVTSVAKRLGFNSEKYLSNVFVRYIGLMGNRDKNKSAGPVKVNPPKTAK